MARIGAEKAKDMGGSQSEFFSLKNDKDEAHVRILYETAEQLDIYATHRIEVDGKERYVECINPEGDERLPSCPGCTRDGYPSIKLFIKLFDITAQKYKVWDRGKTFIPTITGFLDKYKALTNRPYDIVRHGVAKSMDTTYQLFPLDKDDKTLADFEKQPEILGTLVLVKTQQEMQDMIDGITPDSAPTRRKTSGKDVF